MEDTSLMAQLWKFLKVIDANERTDLKCSVMAFEDGYSLQLTAPGRMLNVKLGMQKSFYLTSDCAVISTGEVQA
jgi:hypothetical protein